MRTGKHQDARTDRESIREALRRVGATTNPLENPVFCFGPQNAVGIGFASARGTLIRPGTPGHLLPAGEGTIPTFSHWERVAEGRMRAAAPSGPACRAS